MKYGIFVIYENGTIKRYDEDMGFESAEKACDSLKLWQEMYHEDYLRVGGLYFTFLPVFTR